MVKRSYITQAPLKTTSLNIFSVKFLHFTRKGTVGPYLNRTSDKDKSLYNTKLSNQNRNTTNFIAKLGNLTKTYE